MTGFWEILKYTIPSIVVFAGVYYLMKSYFEKELEKHRLEIKQKDKNLITPVRLQAYERMVLLLERMSPGSLVLRVSKPEFTAFQLQTALIRNIREEFEHNLSQQLYISSQAWNMIKNAKEETVKLINTAASKMSDNATANELSTKIFEIAVDQKNSPIQITLDFLKQEVSQLM